MNGRGGLQVSFDGASRAPAGGEEEQLTLALRMYRILSRTRGGGPSESIHTDRPYFIPLVESHNVSLLSL